jgi:FkbM family methyltransferase
MKRRIRITLKSSDCSGIPKVDGAGENFQGEDVEYQLMHNGVKVVKDCYYGEWMTELIYLLHGHHESQEEKVFHEILPHLSQDSIMLELGSYWGYYSLWFQEKLRNAKNYLIESDLNNLSVGVRNFDLNGMSASFHNFSIDNRTNPDQSFICESDGQERIVGSITVDDFVHKQEIPRIDLLLSDIQGYELRMLEGAADSIAQKKIRFVFISTHHHSISSDPLIHQKCIDFLKTKGACIIAKHSVSESFSGDGLIVASFFDEDQSIDEIPISRNDPSDSLFREIEYDYSELLSENRELRRRNEELCEQCDNMRAKLRSILSSNSYRITKPLRIIKSLLWKRRKAT